MSLLKEMEVAQEKLLGKYCHGCHKYLPKENFSTVKRGGNIKCDKCAVKHAKPKGVATVGGALTVKHKYRG